MMASSTDHSGAAPNVALDKFYRLYGAIGFLPIMLVGLIVLFAIFVPHFLVLPNVLNVLRSSSYLVILAVGQMLVLMVGGFDLSVGAVVALTSVSSALVMAGLKGQMADHPALIILAGVLTGLGCGFLVGLVNGLCVAFLSVSPFMVSLGTASIATGSALLLTNGIPVYGMPVGYVDGFGRGLWLKLPSAVYLAIAIVAVVFVLQNYTRMGRYIVAICRPPLSQAFRRDSI
jgi:ribose transport system permease protein